MSVDPGVLRAVLAVELVVLALLVLLLLGTARLAARRRRHDIASRDRWLDTLTPVLERDRRDEAAGPALRGVSRHQHVLAVSDVVDQFSGDVADRVVSAAGSAEVLSAARRWCRSRLWWRRLKGVRTLVRLGGGQSTVPALLDDPHPEVRAEAAAWVAAHPEGPGVARLVRMLDRDVAQCRFAAQDALLRIGGPASEQLADYLEGPSARRPEVCLRVATGIASARLLPVALARVHDPEASVRAAAAELLAAIGGEQAVPELAALLADANAQVRAAAAAGLGVLAHWPAAPDLAAALGDPAWDVRRAAAEALHELGAVGRLYLRRALVGPDAFAADMARLVLGLPGPAPQVRSR